MRCCWPKGKAMPCRCGGRNACGAAAAAGRRGGSAARRGSQGRGRGCQGVQHPLQATPGFCMYRPASSACDAYVLRRPLQAWHVVSGWFPLGALVSCADLCEPSMSLRASVPPGARHTWAVCMLCKVVIVAGACQSGALPACIDRLERAQRKRVEGGEEQKKKDRPRPGKRQRQALREQWAADPASAPKQARKRARAQAAGDQAMAQPPAGGAGAAAEPRSMKRAVSERASMQPASDGPCAAAEPKSAKRAAIELGRARVAGAGAAGTGGRQKAPECGDIAAGKRARGVGQHLTVPEASEGGLQQRRKMKKAADRLDLVPTAAPASTQHAPTKVCKAARRAAQQPAVA